MKSESEENQWLSRKAVSSLVLNIVTIQVFADRGSGNMERGRKRKSLIHAAGIVLRSVLTRDRKLIPSKVESRFQESRKG